MVHIEAWRRSGLTRTEYCRQHRLTKGAFDRWLTYLAGKESARKLVEYQAELRQQKRRVVSQFDFGCLDARPQVAQLPAMLGAKQEGI